MSQKKNDQLATSVSVANLGVPPIKLGAEPVDIDVRLTLWADSNDGSLRVGFHVQKPKVKRRKPAG